MHTVTELYTNVCFLAHKVAEKLLKVEMLVVCGFHSADINNHRKLYSYACALEQSRPVLSEKGLHKHAAALPLEEYYTTKQDGPTIIPPTKFQQIGLAKVMLGRLRRMLMPYYR